MIKDISRKAAFHCVAVIQKAFDSIYEQDESENNTLKIT